MTILDFFPTEFGGRVDQKPRTNQVAVLKQVQDVWGKSDVIVIRAPVGSGKSPLAQTIAAWATQDKHTAAILTHRVSLQEQYKRDFPTIPTLMGKSRYTCPGNEYSCADMIDMFGDCNGAGCVYTQAKEAAKAAKVAVMNYHIYTYLPDKRNAIICDEFHRVFDILSEMYSLKLWAHKDKYPKGMSTAGDVAVWLEGRIKVLGKEIGRLKPLAKEDKEVAKQLKEATDQQKKFTRLIAGLQTAPANFFLEHKKDFYRGQEKDCLQVRPTSLQNLPPILWRSSGIQKIVLMSGTSNEQDIKKLGLEGMRISYINSANPIPKERRPVDASWGVNMSWEYQDKNMPVLAERIQTLAITHIDTKGLVHLTYGMAEKLKRYLKGDRFLWHDNKNREEVLQRYLESKEPVVLMACGMSEGLDLAGPEFGWQVIAKVPYPSMADKLIAKWASEDSPWYNWMTARTIEQQVGRICRGPDDFGKTYIVDLAFGNIPKKRPGFVQRAHKLFSKDFLESITWEGIKQ